MNKGFHTTPPPGTEIKPIAFRQPAPPGRRFPLRWVLWPLLLLILIGLSGSAWFVLTARQVVIRVAPAPDRVSLTGGILAPRIGAYYLLRPGEYRLEASKSCYQPLKEVIRVTREESQTHQLRMERLPGRLNLQVHERDTPGTPIQGARVRIDGEDVGKTPLKGLEVRAGSHRVHVSASRYQDQEALVDIRGCGEVQSITMALAPGWADVGIRSVPDGAEVLVDGKPSGHTPVTLKLLPGDYQVELLSPRHKTWRHRVTVKADQDQTLGPVRLPPADGRLLLHTAPQGASVTIDDQYLGKTPLEAFLSPDTRHEIRISKEGYERAVREVTLSSGKGTQLSVDLVPVKGVLRFKVEPADAELVVNGESRGKVPKEIQLTAVSIQVEIRKEGYAPFQTTITPRPGFPQELDVALKTDAEAREVGIKPGIRAANGYSLTLVRAGTFVMGASRREQGRRSNETLRKVILERPFYMGVREVTNGEFRQFLSQHRSGTFSRYSLDRDELPVVEVTWEEAARFCNWLSEREGLPPVYRAQGDGMVAVAGPMGTGYRLPTEAEWEYCARFNGTAWLRYPWGDTFPPKAKSGNYADVSDKDLLTNYLPDYNDGYPVTAPPGAFAPNALGLYDMGGNAAEWCHDYYTIYLYSSDTIYRDPAGPAQGKHHVVKGSGWKDSSISELRLSYRDYSKGKRPDLGFRICRYAEEAEDAR